jgi:hypothetical protein
MRFTIQDVLSRLRGVRRSGAGYVALCPAHENRKTQALSIREGRDGRILLYCFAGCSYVQIVEALSFAPQAAPMPVPRTCTPVRHPDDADRIELARRLWRETKPLAGTPAQHYLESRGIHLATWPPTLRYHPSLQHLTGVELPALVAAISGYREGKLHLTAIHRIFITPDGHKADVEPRKASLGSVKGGCARLARPTDRVILTEGIEDAMALMTMYHDDPRFVGWSYAAAVSAGNLPHVELPPEVRTVIVAADNDDPGRKAASEACCRFILEGRNAYVALPPAVFKDFNDALLSEQRETRESAHD